MSSMQNTTLRFNIVGRFSAELIELLSLEYYMECRRMAKHEIIVGNIGTVYEGENKEAAKLAYTEYECQSMQGYGRASCEPVTWLINDEIYCELEV